MASFGRNCISSDKNVGKIFGISSLTSDCGKYPFKTASNIPFAWSLEVQFLEKKRKIFSVFASYLSLLQKYLIKVITYRSVNRGRKIKMMMLVIILLYISQQKSRVKFK